MAEASMATTWLGGWQKKMPERQGKLTLDMLMGLENYIKALFENLLSKSVRGIIFVSS